MFVHWSKGWCIPGHVEEVRRWLHCRHPDSCFCSSLSQALTHWCLQASTTAPYSRVHGKAQPANIIVDVANFIFLIAHLTLQDKPQLCGHPYILLIIRRTIRAQIQMQGLFLSFTSGRNHHQRAWNRSTHVHIIICVYISLFKITEKNWSKNMFCFSCSVRRAYSDAAFPASVCTLNL